MSRFVLYEFGIFLTRKKYKGVRQQMKCPLSVPIEPCVFRINLQKNFSCLVVFACMSLYFCVCSLDETNNFFIEPIVEIFTSFKSFSCLYIDIFPHTHLSHASMNNGAFQPHFLVSCLLLEVFVICKALTFNESF